LLDAIIDRGDLLCLQVCQRL